MKRLLASAVVLVGMTGVGCATKKYVRNQVAPIDQRVNEVGQSASQNKDAIAKLGEKEETDVSRVNERATAAEGAAKDAGEAAKVADQKGSEAQAMARNVDDRVTKLDQSVQAQLNAVDNYQVASNVSVQFRLNSATLTNQEMEKLDSAIQNLGKLQHYVIEVQGFTDSTGPRSYNLSLSQRRADAVVRYLVVKHQVPVYRIHVLGMGNEAPLADNRTRAGRIENRRVEVRLLAAGSTDTHPTVQAAR